MDTSINKDSLSIEDFQTVFRELYEVRVKWHSFGIELKLSLSHLEVIRIRHNNDPDECFKELLCTWLKQVDPKPTWAAVVNALASPTVGYQHLSEVVGGTHVTAPTTCTSSLNLGSICMQPSAEPSSDEQSQIDSEVEQFHCPCGKCDLISYLDNGCPRTTSSSYPYLSIKHLDEDDREDLVQKLSEDTANIIQCFAELLSNTSKSLKKRQVTTEELVKVALDIGAYKSERNPFPLLDEERAKLNAAQSIDGVFIILGKHISFFNYEILSYIIKQVGSADDIINLDKFCCKFEVYCRRKIFEVSPKTISPSRAEKKHRKSFVVLVTQDLVATLADVKIAQRRIASLLGLRVSTLQLEQIDIGSIILVLSIPSTLSHMFPLNNDTRQTLQSSGYTIIVPWMSSNSATVEREMRAVTMPKVQHGVHFEVGGSGKETTIVQEAHEPTNTKLLTEDETESLEVNIHTQSYIVLPAGVSSLNGTSQSIAQSSDLPLQQCSKTASKIKRRPPVDRNQRPKKLFTRKPPAMNCSELLGRGQSFKLDEVARRLLNLNLIRAHSFNHPRPTKSPQTPSPIPLDFSANPRALIMANGGRILVRRGSEVGERDRRWSVASSGYLSGSTNSPESLSTYPSYEQIYQPCVETSRIDTLKSKYAKTKEEVEKELKVLLSRFFKTQLELSDAAINHKCKCVLESVLDILKTPQNEVLPKDSFDHVFKELAILLLNVGKHDEPAATGHECIVRKTLILLTGITAFLGIMEFEPEISNSALKSDDLDQSQMTNLMMPSTYVPYIISKLNLSLTHPNVTEESSPRQSSFYERLASSLSQQPSVDDFNIIKFISIGTYSAIYLVRHKETHQKFAMKMSNKHHMFMKKHFQQDLVTKDIPTFAENPFVAGQSCTIQGEGHLYYVMEYVEGGDMATLIKTIGWIPVDMAKLYFAETVMALEYLHSHGIIHGQLQCRNLLITSEGHIKLSDFGLSTTGLECNLAHLMDNVFSHNTHDQYGRDAKACQYIAPEVILGQGRGRAMDWWSIGVILYEMVIGSKPFLSYAVQDFLHNIANNDLEIYWPEDAIPKEGIDIIGKLVCYNPLERLDLDAVKNHPFLYSLNWTHLLRQKAEFTLASEGIESCSYFDCHSDSFSEDLISDDDEIDGKLYKQRWRTSSRSSHHEFEHQNDQSHLTTQQQVLLQQPQQEILGSTNVSEIRRDSGVAGVEETLSLDSMKLLLEELNKKHSLGSTIVGDSSENISLLSESTNMGEASNETTEDEEVSADDLITNIDEYPDNETLVERPGVKRATSFSVQEAFSSSYSRSTHKNRRSSLSESPLVSISHELGKMTVSPLVVSSTVTDDAKRKTHTSSIEDLAQQSLSIRVSPPSPGGSMLCMVTSPMTIPRKERSYGFTLKTIRIYIGETSDYRMHHIIGSVDKGSQAWEAGLRPGHLITHINNKSITELQHVQVLCCMGAGTNSNSVSISTIPLEKTSISMDTRRRDPSTGHRVCKLLRHRSSGSERMRERPKLPLSLHKKDSLKDRRVSKLAEMKLKFDQKLVSPFTQSTSQSPLLHVVTPDSLLPGPMHGVPPHHSPSNLQRFPSLKGKGNSPSTSPLFKRVLSSSDARQVSHEKFTYLKEKVEMSKTNF